MKLNIVFVMAMLMVAGAFAQSERIPVVGDCFNSPVGVWILTKIDKINETKTFTEAYNYKLNKVTNDTLIGDIQLNGLWQMISEQKIECPVIDLPPEPGLPPEFGRLPLSVVANDPVKSQSCNEDKSICATVGPPVHGPYVRQNPIYTYVDYLPNNYLVTKSYVIRINSVSNQPNELIRQIIQTVPFGSNLYMPVIIPPGFSLVKKRLDNVYFYDSPGDDTFYPSMYGAEVVR